jgi:poly-gamma-glutamate synthesis protein (capsule biosynthesis protein)
VCTLANNHVLDWGAAGLVETLDTLHAARLKTAGAGRDLAEAEAPAVVEVSSSARVLVFALGSPTSGVPMEWSAGRRKPGVAWFEERSLAAVDALASRIGAIRRPRDVIIVSVHWGDNWGWEIPKEQVAFAHALVDRAGVDVVFGHSSHHPKGIEVFHDRLVLYGCGDLIDDYEGIGGHEAFMSDRVLSYAAHLDEATGRLARLDIVPFRLRGFRLTRPDEADVRWLRSMLDREGRPLGTHVERGPHGLALRWD